MTNLDLIRNIKDETHLHLILFQYAIDCLESDWTDENLNTADAIKWLFSDVEPAKIAEAVNTINEDLQKMVEENNGLPFA